MKRFLVFVLAMTILLSLSGCGNTDHSVQAAVPNQWGVTLEAEKVTPRGLTIVCTQSGGTHVAELFTGSDYTLQKLDNEEWISVDYIPQKYQLAWTSEAWDIQQNGTTRWDVNWKWVYGKLPAGHYRIGKEIVNSRGPGDYDEEMVYAEFVIP